MTGAWQNVFQKQLAEIDRINLYKYVQGGHMMLQSAATITGLTEDAFQEQMDAYFQTQDA